MFFSSQNPVLSQALVEAFLAALTAVPSGALLTTPKVHLYTASSAALSPQSTVAQFTEATFTGYADVALSSWSAPVVLPPPNTFGVFASANFVAGSITAPGQNVLGYWVDNGTTTFYMAEAFPSAIPISAPGDFVALSVIIAASALLQTG